MFSHIVIFWTKPNSADATEQLLAGATKYLSNIDGVQAFHVGRMVPSHRGVVEQTYQVALNITFATKADQDRYQDDPQHLEFIAKCAHLWVRVQVFDFE